MSEPRAVTFAELVAHGALTIGDGYRAKLEELGGDGPIFLRAGLLSKQGIDWDTAERFRAEVIPKLQSKLGMAGDTMVTTKGNSVGRTGYVPAGAPAFVYSPHLSYWRSLDPRRLSSPFLYYWSRSQGFVVQLQAMAHGTDMAPYLSLSDQYRLKITLPIIEVQDAIAQVLGSLDDKIAANDRVAYVCHELAETFFQSATRVSAQVPLSSLTDPVLGGTPDRAIAEYWGSGHPWASAKDVAASKFGALVATEEEITDLAANRTKAKPVAKGSVILTARGTVGMVARVAQPTALNQSCYAFIPGLIPPGVLYLMVRAAARQMLGVAHGTVFSTVNMKTFDHIQTPSLSETDLNALEDKVAPLLNMVEGRIQENGSLANLRDTLLPKLISGDIRVREAEQIVEDAT